MTVKKQLMRLPKKYAMLALYNLRRVRANNECDSVRDAVDIAFNWSETRQGHHFWQQVANWARINLDNKQKEYKLPQIDDRFKKTISIQSQRIENSTRRRILRRERNSQELTECPVDVVQEPQAVSEPAPERVSSGRWVRASSATPTPDSAFFYYELPRVFFED